MWPACGPAGIDHRLLDAAQEPSKSSVARGACSAGSLGHPLDLVLDVVGLLLDACRRAAAWRTWAAPDSSTAHTRRSARSDIRECGRPRWACRSAGLSRSCRRCWRARRRRSSCLDQRRPDAAAAVGMAARAVVPVVEPLAFGDGVGVAVVRVATRRLRLRTRRAEIALARRAVVNARRTGAGRRSRFSRWHDVSARQQTGDSCEDSHVVFPSRGTRYSSNSF